MHLGKSDGHQAIHLITPPASAKALEAALSQNPHLTSLPLPRADILAPKELSHTTGTAKILRLPEVQAAINGDFMVLPCDLVCEVPGETFLESWMDLQSPLGGAPESFSMNHMAHHRLIHRRARRKGGLGVWFETRAEDNVKGAETDFVITTPLPCSVAPSPSSSLRSHISKLLYATTTDTLRDITQEKGGFPIRNGLIRKHGKIRMLTTYRDAHIYLFPHWVVDMVQRSEKFDSISEDVVGWWAKAEWQDGLADKLHMNEAIEASALKSTKHSEVDGKAARPSDDDGIYNLTSHQTSTLWRSFDGENTSIAPPPILSYIHPHPSPMLVRRVDTPALLLSTSIHLASLPPSRDPALDATPTPLSHQNKVSADPSLIALHTTIQADTTLIAPNTSIATHCTIKTSCIGANCVIGEGVKILGSLLMDLVQVEAKVQLQGCILGRRCIIGKGAKLEGCEVQEGFKVADGTIGSKGEKFCVFEGLEDGSDGRRESEDEGEEGG